MTWHKLKKFASISVFFILCSCSSMTPQRKIASENAAGGEVGNPLSRVIMGTGTSIYIRNLMIEPIGLSDTTQPATLLESGKIHIHDKAAEVLYNEMTDVEEVDNTKDSGDIQCYIRENKYSCSITIARVKSGKIH